MKQKSPNRLLLEVDMGERGLNTIVKLSTVRICSVQFAAVVKQGNEDGRISSTSIFSNDQDFGPRETLVQGDRKTDQSTI